jgi:hypothetical protein
MLPRQSIGWELVERRIVCGVSKGIMSKLTTIYIDLVHATYQY